MTSSACIVVLAVTSGISRRVLGTFQAGSLARRLPKSWLDAQMAAARCR